MPLQPTRPLNSARLGVVCGAVLSVLGFASLMITSVIFAASTASADHAWRAPLSDTDVSAGEIARDVPPTSGSGTPSTAPTASAARQPAKVAHRSTATAKPSHAGSGGSSGSGVSPFAAAPAGPASTQPSIAARPAANTQTSRPTSSPAPASTPVRSTSGGSSAYVDETAAAQWLFNVINQNRAAQGRPALKWDSRLKTTTYNHCVFMARNNTLSHQLPGEPSLAQRVTSQGVVWTSLGENAAYSYKTGGSGVDAAREVNDVMMAEGPGTPGSHYDNIMSTQFNHVGIAVIWDAAHQRMWITEDFATE